MRRLIVMGCLALLGLTGCNVNRRIVRNESLWYKISVPRTWKVREGYLESNRSDMIQIQRLRNDARLSMLIESTRLNIQRDMVGFVMETESRKQIAGQCTWQIVGAHRPSQKEPERVIIRVLIDTNKKKSKDCEEGYDPGEYKYVITVTTPSESYNERKAMLQQIINSFSFKIPEY